MHFTKKLVSRAIPTGALAVIACGSPEAPPMGSANSLQVCYRGELREAEEIDGIFYVEGDLEVTPTEMDCGLPDAKNITGRRAPAGEGSVWPSGTYGVKWPGGRVPYQISSGFTSTQRDEIIQAMQDWNSVAPGLHFVARTGADTSYVDFIGDAGSTCSSGYGALSDAARTVRYADRCFGSFTIHHEIGHAIGLQHEHTRSDRDNYVVASSSSENYMVDDGANLFEYDFDSIMHYSLSSVLSLAPGVAVPDGVTVGQRDHLSKWDVASARAMYPVLELNKSAFVATGNSVRLCRLTGRDDDAATRFRLVNPGEAASFEFDGARLTFDETLFAERGTVSLEQECGARSNFWANNYSYPNSDESHYGTGTAFNELFETDGHVTLMTVGLAPVLL